MQDFKGAKWYKCDFHLHTPASDCFRDKTVTPEQYIQKVKEAGLKCIAITDHNSAGWIEKIQELVQEENIVMFPGVEITCDTSKIHLLVLFDVDKKASNVEDFLIRCDISRDSFGKTTSHSSKNVLEVCQIANDHNCIVIPAHIDEMSGLGDSLSNSSMEELLQLEYISACQIVHKKFLDEKLKVKDNKDLEDYINNHYNNPNLPIGLERISNWYKAVKKAVEKGKNLVTFSDNPDSEKPSNHGLDGIGKMYTWIKMDEKPTLESLRQSLLVSENIHNCFDEFVVDYPSSWVKSISFEKTRLNKDDNPVIINFNPQLNTIIGGRGSGKSSILRFLRGVLSQTKDLDDFGDIKDDQTEFFKLYDSKTKKGILTNESKIVIEFVRNDSVYYIEYCNKERKIYLINETNGEKEEKNINNYSDFFEIEQYSQKQIFEIAKKPNSLRLLIDRIFPEIEEELFPQRRDLDSDYLRNMVSIRQLQSFDRNREAIAIKLDEVNNKINTLSKSGISTFVNDKKIFDSQIAELDRIRKFERDCWIKFEDNVKYISSFSIDKSLFEEKYNVWFDQFILPIQQKVLSFKTALEALMNTSKAELQNLFAVIDSSSFFVDYSNLKEKLEVEKKRLEEQGIINIADYDNLQKEKNVLEEKLEKIKNNESEINILIEKNREIIAQKEKLNKKIFDLRRSFDQRIGDKNIRIQIKSNKDKEGFVQEFRAIINRKNDEFRDDVDAICKYIFEGNTPEKLKSFKEEIRNIHNGFDGVDLRLNGKFINLIRDLNDEQIDKIDLLYPEDDIEISYKTKSERSFKPLSTASAGQKTTAVLTVILSIGDKPLVLDQPEDDLDNHYVYGLVVSRLNDIKQKRQVIVVTHNANIPVNANAEYVIALSSDTKHIDIKTDGTIERQDIKNEICEVMEGGFEAFKARAQKYNLKLQ